MPKPARYKRALPRPRHHAFTLLELLIVISIIIILAGLILATSGYVQKKGARSRAEAEIAAMSAALESYKADNGIYPRDGNTDVLFAVTDTSFASKNPPDPKPTSYDGSAIEYRNASLSLYKSISGDSDGDGRADSKSYFPFKPQMLGGTKDANGNLISIGFIRDPFGNSYGYSTSYQADVSAGNSPARGFNPTYDLWCTIGETAPAKAVYEQAWIKNW